MRVRISFDFYIEHRHWLFAADMGEAKTKSDAIAYLKEQVKLFGSDDCSLMGESFAEGEYSEEKYKKLARCWSGKLET